MDCVAFGVYGYVCELRTLAGLDAGGVSYGGLPFAAYLGGFVDVAVQGVAGLVVGDEF